MTRPRYRVLVLLGTDYHPFDRAVRWVDDWARAHPEAEVFVQHGSSNGPQVASGAAFIDHSDLERRLESSDLVVSHGGPATIAEARSVGHLPIVLPRDPEQGEHVDGHQLRFSAWAHKHGLVRRITGEAELHAALDAALTGDDVVALKSREQAELAVQQSVHRFADLVAATGSDVAGDPVVAYIAGFGRSGSTLLERLLGETPGVTVLGEVVHLWQRGLVMDEFCACGEPFSRCALWQEIGKEAFGGWSRIDPFRVLELHDQVDRQRRLLRTASPLVLRRTRNALREYANYYGAIYRAAARLTNAEVIVDSSKHVSLAFALAHDPDIDLRVLHMVRDPRAVAYSWSRRVERPESRSGEEMPRYSSASSSMWWLTNNAMSELLRPRGLQVTRVHYERLVDDPLGTLHRAAQALDLPVTPQLDLPEPGQVRLGESHSVAGNPMRFTHGVISLNTDDAWRTSMEPGARRLVGALTSPVRFAYSRSERRS